MTAQEIDRIQNAIRHIQTSVDVDPWAVEIAVEAMKKQISEKPFANIDVCNKNLGYLYCPTCCEAVGVYNKRLKNTAMYNSANSKICAQCEQMKLSEAITHCEEVAEESEKEFRLCPYPTEDCNGTQDCRCLENGEGKGCLKCAAEHKQLAEWLKELKEFRERNEK